MKGEQYQLLPHSKTNNILNIFDPEYKQNALQHYCLMFKIL